MSSQYVAMASQNCTLPLVTGALFWSVTVAVNTTAVPTVTLDDDTLNVVAVFKPPQAGRGMAAKQTASKISGLERLER
jgi:hypothetical protein